MGELMRQYWLPALLSSEVPEPDCPPVRVRLLGENLIGFRNTSGTVGLIDNECPHRCASLFYGRNEEDGLRCVYHGWKWAVDGRCLDMPNEPAESNFKDKVRVNAYPCVERNGVVWTYMGRRSEPPPLPDIEPNMLPDGQWALQKIFRECNWFQGLEGDIDTSHLAFLHLGAATPDQMKPGSFDYYTVKDRAPRYAVLDTEFGTSYGAYRPAEADTTYWRVAHFLFPFYTMIPTGFLGKQILVRAWVPMDDDHMMFWSMSSPSTRVMGQGGGAASTTGLPSTMRGMDTLPDTTDWYGKFRLASNAANDYRIDRVAQRAGSFTGIEGIHTQDQAITESMGPIVNRHHEHLGSSDAMIIRTRRRLINAAKALQESRIVPPGVDDPSVYRYRSGGVILPNGVDWLAATKELRKAFVEPAPALSGDD
jgi:phenylpropionate dioxygenase-like ring-hydroxylating dioxygenase large terminal subunit